jgi:hypothetical protein
VVVAIGEAAQEQGSGVVCSPSTKCSSWRSTSWRPSSPHSTVQRGLPITFVGAGLPQLPELAGEAKSYAERLFRFPTVGSLPAEEAATALRGPASSLGETKLDESFSRVRADRTTELELRYLRAMAELGSEPEQARDVAEVLGRTSQQLGPTRARLIEKGLLYTPGYGLAAFTVPQFDRYMRRNHQLVAP